MRPALRPRLLVLAIGAAAAGLGGCASHVKGSWACALQPGVVCGSIAEIDRAAPGKGKPNPRASAADPVIDGAIPARLWGQGGWSAGAIAGAPVREPDPILKVAVAPWIDGEGDYHAGAEIFALMRQGGWFIAAPSPPPRRVDLTRLAMPAPTPPAPTAPTPSAPTPSAQTPSGKTSGVTGPTAARTRTAAAQAAKASPRP